MKAEDRLFALRAVAGAAGYMTEAIARAGAVPDGARDPAGIARVGVLGAGTMGRGIAMAFAQTGREVVLADPSDDARAEAMTHLSALAERKRSKGQLDEVGRAALMARIRPVAGLEAFSDADLVVEVVPEVMALKQKVMAGIEAQVRPDTLITSNTSTLDVDAIASALRFPARFIGTHFFMPAQVNRLLELVPASATADGTTAAALALARDLGKQAVIAANGDGFIGNRLFDRFHQEAMYVVEEGAWPEDVDTALEDWGMAIGPFRALDLVGNDIPWGVRRQRAERAVPPPQPRIGDALCEAGWHGQKCGRGWYLYDSATPRGRPYADVHALIRRGAAAMGIARRRIGAREIVGRCVTALMAEGLAMLAEGRAAAASDIDMVYVTGYGFPAALGGPMRLCEEIGRGETIALTRHYGEISGRAGTAWALPRALAQGEAMA